MLTTNATYHSKYLGETSHEDHPELPMSFTCYAKFDTREEGAEFIARFPKYVGIKQFRDGNGFHFRVTLSADEVNKGVNEAGIKRIRKFIELAGDLGWENPYRNGYNTVEEFLAAIS